MDWEKGEGNLWIHPSVARAIQVEKGNCVCFRCRPVMDETLSIKTRSEKEGVKHPTFDKRMAGRWRGALSSDEDVFQ